MSRFSRAFLVPIIVLMIIFTGCEASSYSVLSCNENSTSSSWTMNYKSLKGKVSHGITLGEKGGIVSGDIKTSSGSVEIIIKNSDDEQVYASDKFSSDGSFEFKLDEGGRYMLWIVTDEHSGSVNLEWADLTGEKS